MAEIESAAWPPPHREIDTDGVRIIATEVQQPCTVLRLYPEDSPFYNRVTVAVPRDGGREVFLMGAVEPIPPRSRWRAAKAALFPDAKVATFERREDDGTVRIVRFPI